MFFAAPTALADDDCAVADPDPADPTDLVVEWEPDAAAVLPTELSIYVPDADDVLLEAEYTLTFDGASLSWTEGPWAPDALDVITTELGLPDGAPWDPEQAWRFATLEVKVSAWAGGQLRVVQGSTVLRVALPESSEEPVVVPAEELEAVAPGGVLLEYAPADEAGAWEVIAAEGV